MKTLYKNRENSCDLHVVYIVHDSFLGNYFHSLTLSASEVHWDLCQPLFSSWDFSLAVLLSVPSLTSLAGDALSSFADSSAGYSILFQLLRHHFGFLLFVVLSLALWLVSRIQFLLPPRENCVFLFRLFLFPKLLYNLSNRSPAIKEPEPIYLRNGYLSFSRAFWQENVHRFFLILAS